MAYTANIVTVAEMQFMAGKNRDATGDVEANHIILQNYAEAYLSSLTKFDIAGGFATMNAVYKILFSEWAARFGGNALIKFNMAGYSDVIEAENMIKMNWQRMLDIEALLNQASVQDFQGV